MRHKAPPAAKCAWALCAIGHAARPRFGKIDPDSPVGRNENPMGDRTNTPRYENQEKNGPDVATVAPFGTSEMRFPF